METKKIKDFTDLLAWKEGHKLVLIIYKVIQKFPSDERFSLSDQLRRASISVTSNIAEGFGRQTYKEKLHFYYQAQGSLVELKNQLIIARDVGYLSNNDYKNILDQANHAHKLLQGLIMSTKKILNS